MVGVLTTWSPIHLFRPRTFPFVGEVQIQWDVGAFHREKLNCGFPLATLSKDETSKRWMVDGRNIVRLSTDTSLWETTFPSQLETAWTSLWKISSAKYLHRMDAESLAHNFQSCFTIRIFCVSHKTRNFFFLLSGACSLSQLVRSQIFNYGEGKAFLVKRFCKISQLNGICVMTRTMMALKLRRKIKISCKGKLFLYRFAGSGYKLYSVQRHSLYNAVHMCPGKWWRN